MLTHYIWVLGSDKNRKNVSRTRAKYNASGTTSLSNNAIQNTRQLSRVDKHNYRKYDDKGHLIEIIRGTTSLYNDVQKLYKDEIEDLKEKNSKLQSTINFLENLFDKLVKFIKDKMFGKEKEREDYWNFSKDLYTHNIFSDKTIESI